MKINKKKRGRPRQNRPQVDRGTEELQQKRQMILGGGNRQDPALAESLLGILYARELISRPLYEAGQFFGELGYRYEPCLGHKFRQNSSPLEWRIVGRYSPFLLSNDQSMKRTMAWHQALEALKYAGGGAYKTVLNVVFYDQDLYAAPIQKFIFPSLHFLQKGLEFLDNYFKEGMQAGRGKRFDRGNLQRSTMFQHPAKGLRSYSLP